MPLRRPVKWFISPRPITLFNTKPARAFSGRYPERRKKRSITAMLGKVLLYYPKNLPLRQKTNCTSRNCPVRDEQSRRGYLQLAKAIEAAHPYTGTVLRTGDCSAGGRADRSGHRAISRHIETQSAICPGTTRSGITTDRLACWCRPPDTFNRAAQTAPDNPKAWNRRAVPDMISPTARSSTANCSERRCLSIGNARRLTTRTRRRAGTQSGNAVTQEARKKSFEKAIRILPNLWKHMESTPAFSIRKDLGQAIYGRSCG